MDEVKSPRSYRQTRRAAATAKTRAAVLKAARACFVAKGWSGTTIAAIAARAKVSPETIYASFGSKSALMVETLRAAVRGEEAEVPLLEQAAPRAIAASRDQRRQLAIFTEDIAGVLERVAPLMDVVRAGAATDRRLQALYREFHDGRRRNLGFVARALLATAPLRDGQDEEQATAAIWRLASPELFMLMRNVEGTDRTAYAAWLLRALSDALLVQPGPGSVT